MHAIEYTREAAKALMRMPRDMQQLILRKIEAVAARPYAQHNNVKRLQGRPEYRLRVHDWRVIYRVLDDRVVLLVIKIGTRGQVYE
ncbi:MAG: type II toxin-antitoxin system RelE family toxin [Hylemonella sp.]